MDGAGGVDEAVVRVAQAPAPAPAPRLRVVDGADLLRAELGVDREIDAAYQEVPAGGVHDPTGHLERRGLLEAGEPRARGEERGKRIRIAREIAGGEGGGGEPRAGA